MNTQSITLDTPVELTQKRLAFEKMVFRKRMSAGGLRAGFQLTVAPSYACDLLCNHCFVPHHNPNGLDESDVLRIIDEWSEIVATERGVFGGTFHLQGGEPLMLPYLDNILFRLGDRRVLCFKMTTNGVNPGARTIKLLRNLNQRLMGNLLIMVSLDGSCDAVNAHFRGEGCFAKAVAFVGLLRENGVAVQLNNVVHRENAHDIEAYVQMALKLDVQRVEFTPYIPCGVVERMRFGAPDPVKLMDKIQTLMEKGDIRVKTLLADTFDCIMQAEARTVMHESLCVQERYKGNMFIEPDGTVYSCTDVHHFSVKAGNIKKMSLAEIHEQLQSRLFAAHPHDEPIDFEDY